MRRFGKKDAILITALLGIALLSLLFVSVFIEKNGSQVEVTIDGELYGTYELNKDQTIPIEVKNKVTNTLSIQDNTAKMIDATCPDKLCMHQKKISAVGETIVCLPNKIVITVVGDTKSEFDSVAN